MKAMSARMSIRPVVACLLAACAGAAAAPKPGIETYYCAIHHYVRNAGAELHSAAISVRNPDTAHAASIERLTIRNGYGDIVHDSGPAAGVAHPLNTDFTPPLDITVVPPGASYYLQTRHIWGLDGLPPSAGGAQAGFLMSATLEIAKANRKVPVFVGRRDTVRERPASAPPVEGPERSSSAIACVRLD